MAGLNLQAISITSAFTSILNFFKSQENNSRWKDLTSGAEGIFLIRMLANVITNISYRLITARRENYLSTANLLSSVLGMAVNYGYSANRGRNQRRLIQLIPDGNYTLPKFTVLGSYDGTNDIILLGHYEDKVLDNGTIQRIFVEGATLKENIPVDLVTTVGVIKDISFQAGTNEIRVFQQYTDKISEDYMLFVDKLEVPTSNKVQDLIHNKYLVRTNPSASIDIMYYNNAVNATHSYGTESMIDLKYIELDDIDVGDYDSTMFDYGTLANVLTINDFVPFESVENIKLNAPLQHATEGIVRSKVDYTNRVKDLVPNIVETSYTAITPSYTLITYLKDDLTLVTDEEKDTLMAQLRAGERLMGTPLPDLTPPRRELINLNIYLELNNTFKDANDIKSDVDNILASNYEVALEQSFNVYSLERLLESLSYVFRARVSYDMKSRTNSTSFQLGEIITKNGNYYKASKILGLSGESAPLWTIPTEPIKEIDTGIEIEDGSVYWKCYKRLDVEDITEWQPRTKYALGDYVYVEDIPDYMFKCVDLKKYSSTTAPDVTLIKEGDFLVDGSIIWVCKITNISVPDRENSTAYRLGDSVNIGGATFECVSYTGYTATSEPVFEKNYYDVASVSTSAVLITGDYTDFFKEDDVIKLTSDNTAYTLIVTGSSYNILTNKTTVSVRQTLNTNKNYTVVTPRHRGTKDGDILWEIVPEDADFNIVQYGWNVYNSFAYNLTTGAM